MCVSALHRNNENSCKTWCSTQSSLCGWTSWGMACWRWGKFYYLTALYQLSLNFVCLVTPIFLSVYFMLLQIGQAFVAFMSIYLQWTWMCFSQYTNNWMFTLCNISRLFKVIHKQYLSRAPQPWPPVLGHLRRTPPGGNGTKRMRIEAVLPIAIAINVCS